MVEELLVMKYLEEYGGLQLVEEVGSFGFGFEGVILAYFLGREVVERDLLGKLGDFFLGETEDSFLNGSLQPNADYDDVIFPYLAIREFAIREDLTLNDTLLERVAALSQVDYFRYSDDLSSAIRTEKNKTKLTNYISYRLNLAIDRINKRKGIDLTKFNYIL